MKKLSMLVLSSLLVSNFAGAADQISSKSASEILKQSFQLAKEGKKEEALKQVNALIKEDPKNINALRTRGNIFFAENKFEEAYKDFNKIVELQPANARAYFNRGMAGFTIGKETQSVVDIDFALAMDPQLMESLNAAPKIRAKVEELRKNALSSVGNVRHKKGAVNFKKGNISIKEKSSGK